MAETAVLKYDERYRNASPFQQTPPITPKDQYYNRFSSKSASILKGSPLSLKPRPVNKICDDSVNSEEEPDQISELIRGGSYPTIQSDAYSNFFEDITGWEEEQAELVQLSQYKYLCSLDPSAVSREDRPFQASAGVKDRQLLVSAKKKTKRVATAGVIRKQDTFKKDAVHDYQDSIETVSEIRVRARTAESRPLFIVHGEPEVYSLSNLSIQGKMRTRIEASNAFMIIEDTTRENSASKLARIRRKLCQSASSKSYQSVPNIGSVNGKSFPGSGRKIGLSASKLLAKQALKTVLPHILLNSNLQNNEKGTNWIINGKNITTQVIVQPTVRRSVVRKEASVTSNETAVDESAYVLEKDSSPAFGKRRSSPKRLSFTGFKSEDITITSASPIHERSWIGPTRKC